MEEKTLIQHCMTCYLNTVFTNAGALICKNCQLCSEYGVVQNYYSQAGTLFPNQYLVGNNSNAEKMILRQ